MTYTTDEIRAMLAAATPGPWVWDGDDLVGHDHDFVIRRFDYEGHYFVGKNWDGNQNLTAAARTIAALAIAQAEEIERLRKAFGILEDALQEAGDDYPGSSMQQWAQQQVSAARAAIKEPKP